MTGDRKGGVNATFRAGGRGFRAVLHRDPRMLVAECPVVGTVSQGYTRGAALANLREATELYLQELSKAKQRGGT